MNTWLLLHLVSGVGRRTFHELIQRFETPENVFSAPLEQIMAVSGISRKRAEAIRDAPHSYDLESEIRLVEQYNAEVIHFKDPEQYPSTLARMSVPPPVLYKRGTFSSSDTFPITVIGSRSCTSYGKLMCERIVRSLVDYGFTIASGAATGIDTFSHRTALKHNGRSIAVVPSGLGRLSSSRTRRLVEEVVSNGVVLSELPMKRHEERSTYAPRNSILAGLGIATVVIEAAPRSGSMMTAYLAIDENRLVFAVPGDVTRRTSRGCHALIREGAMLVETGDDVVEAVQHMIGKDIATKFALSPAGNDKTESAAVNALTEIERKLYDSILYSPVSFEELILTYGAEKIGTLSSSLLQLELKGLITQLPGKVYTTKK